MRSYHERCRVMGQGEKLRYKRYRERDQRDALSIKGSGIYSNGEATCRIRLRWEPGTSDRSICLREVIPGRVTGNRHTSLDGRRESTSFPMVLGTCILPHESTAYNYTDGPQLKRGLLSVGKTLLGRMTAKDTCPHLEEKWSNQL